ncbi:MAG: IclR family transcriptional regulator [Firmicutes bacterium]|nr:IclR family transcriptional regulator [Bacillota bacterium]MCL5057895.1 IclR family transcriptional regulator [Actinomycetota bacterium]
MADHSAENPVHSVERALVILEALGRNSRGYGCTELGQLLNLHKSTVHRLVSTLLSYGFVEKDPHNDKYRLGIKIMHMGLEALNSLDFRKVAIPFIQELVQISRETVQLAVLEGNNVLVVERDHSPEAITVNLGLRSEVHCTAEGKLLMSYLAPDKAAGILREKPMRQYTINTITEITPMISHLEKIRSQGFAINAEEMVEGVRALAAPVFDHNGRNIAALSIAGPSSRLSLERIYRLVTVLKETCASISMQLGYNTALNPKDL